MTRDLRFWLASLFLHWIVMLLGEDLSNDGLRAVICLQEEMKTK